MVSRFKSLEIPLGFPIVAVWGSNTGIGKTLFSAGLAASCSRNGIPVAYIKPVQTGYPEDIDARLVNAAAGNMEVNDGQHASMLGRPPANTSSKKNSSGFASTLFAWKTPVSPHLAVELEGRAVTDDQILQSTASMLQEFKHRYLSQNPSKFAIIETAGGVASPSPTGTLQCDLFRALRLPALLIGDGRLGGISSTLAAYETLILRGHTVAAIALMENDAHELKNQEMIARHVDIAATNIISVPFCRPPPEDSSINSNSYSIDANLAAWLKETQPQFNTLLTNLTAHHTQRVNYLDSAAKEAEKVLWWPFTQHGTLNKGKEKQVQVIDARVGDRFVVVDKKQKKSDKFSEETTTTSTSTKQPNDTEELYLRQLHDGSSSWWTQGVSEHNQPTLARSLGHAAARYGHVMYPQNVHQPALDLAKTLVDIANTCGPGWASRVFYSDDGSTAVEVALKMAFRKYMVDHQLLDKPNVSLQVLGLQEAYHGDTLGAMDAVAPSVFNGRLQTPWFTGRGVFLDSPTVGIVNGRWQIISTTAADGSSSGGGIDVSSYSKDSLEFDGRDALLDIETRLSSSSNVVDGYRQHIKQAIDTHIQSSNNNTVQIGACIIEPILQGAGGMRFVDPLYQRIIVDICQERNIPVIYDEVFSGLWRLGVPSAGALLGADPSIACYAKLLTGGTIPLSATVTNERVFEAFKGDEKAYALLHGHSYSAHAIGCAAGVTALKMLSDPTINPNICSTLAATSSRNSSSSSSQSVITGGDSGSRLSEVQCSRNCTKATRSCGKLLALWDESRAVELSKLPSVARVVPFGTVLAIELKSNTAGYASVAAAGVVRQLKQAGVDSRPLGNVVYLMVTPMADKKACDELFTLLESILT